MKISNFLSNYSDDFVREVALPAIARLNGGNYSLEDVRNVSNAELSSALMANSIPAGFLVELSIASDAYEDIKSRGEIPVNLAEVVATKTLNTCGEYNQAPCDNEKVNAVKSTKNPSDIHSFIYGLVEKLNHDGCCVETSGNLYQNKSDVDPANYYCGGTTIISKNYNPGDDGMGM